MQTPQYSVKRTDFSAWTVRNSLDNAAHMSLTQDSPIPIVGSSTSL